MSKSRHSPFDYSVTLSRKLRYLVVQAPEFGVFVPSGMLDLGSASPEQIGLSVLEAFHRISQELRRRDLAGEPHPKPFRRRPRRVGRVSRVA